MTDQTTSLRPALEAELERLRDTDVGRRMTAIQVLLAEEGEAGSIKTRATKARRSPGVSAPKLRAITQYMQSKGTARQVDVYKDLDENSGTVSLAMQHLESEGVVEDTGEIESKSKVWRYIGPTNGDSSGRIPTIEPGVGLSEGRKR